MNNRIFIAGVHGAGKGYLASRLSEALSLTAYSCSSIIKNYIGKLPEDKKISNPERTQKFLIDGADNLIGDSPAVLDGHFCLFNSDGRIQPILTHVFSRLKLKIILLVTADPDLIVNRLKVRDNIEHKLEHIDQLQKEEIKQARLVATHLSIPIFELQSGDDLDGIIREIHE